ncbi:hypothetical protein ACE2AJ_02080 [Aquihabitans daechungensis]|uniref:hypothetical protein n=1 Tax=Aquihabitans daechungensis TaxID=1052257 RepID=UPI003BA34D35
MAGRRSGAGSGGGGRPKGPKVGSILTGMIVGQAKKGVMVELGSTEILLPRAKYGAAADRIEESMYGDALTVEVVADQQSGGVGLTRVGIERSLRQPREIAGRLRREGAGFVLVPDDGSGPIDVVVLDRTDVDDLVGDRTSWMVGATYRDRRFVVPSEA